MSLPKLIVLQSSDKETFEVNEAVAVQLLTIKHMIIDNCPGSYIPVRNVRGKILAKVIEYCTKHIDVAKTSDDEIRETQDDALKAFDKEFVNVDQETLFDVMLAANYLEIKSLLDLTCQTVAYMMKGKKVEEIREIFHIKNDYIPEEEEEVRRENAWAFE